MVTVMLYDSTSPTDVRAYLGKLAVRCTNVIEGRTGVSLTVEPFADASLPSEVKSVTFVGSLAELRALLAVAERDAARSG